MSYTFTKISNKGSSNPIMARLFIQMTNLLQWSSISNDEKEKIKKLLLEGLVKQLNNCWDIRQTLLQDADKAILNLQNKENEMPYIVDLDIEVEKILYSSKNFFRDLVQIINVFWSTNFDGASSLYSDKPEEISKIAKKAIKKYGDSDPITKLLVDDIEWIKELCYKRNAKEHLGGWCGGLEINNLSKDSDGNFIEPTWCRKNNEKYKGSEVETGLLKDLEIDNNNMFIFAELVLVLLLEKTTRYPLVVVEIPENERDPDLPVRFKFLPSI